MCVMQEDMNFHRLTNNALRRQINSQEAFLARERRKRNTRALAAGASSPLRMFPGPHAAFNTNNNRRLLRRQGQIQQNGVNLFIK